MRCKPGDLAIIIRAMDPRLLGRVVSVIRWVQKGEVLAPGAFYYIEAGCTGWMVKTPENKTGCFEDRCLLPIRPEGELLDVDQDLEVPV